MSRAPRSPAARPGVAAFALAAALALSACGKVAAADESQRDRAPPADIGDQQGTGLAGNAVGNGLVGEETGMTGAPDEVSAGRTVVNPVDGAAVNRADAVKSATQGGAQFAPMAVPVAAAEPGAGQGPLRWLEDLLWLVLACVSGALGGAAVLCGYLLLRRGSMPPAPASPEKTAAMAPSEADRTGDRDTGVRGEHAAAARDQWPPLGTNAPAREAPRPRALRDPMARDAVFSQPGPPPPAQRRTEPALPSSPGMSTMPLAEIAQRFTDVAAQAPSIDDYAGAIRQFGELYDARLVGDDVEIRSEFSGSAPEVFLTAIALGGRRFAIVPSFQYVKDFPTSYYYAYLEQSEISVAFDTDTDGSHILRCLEPGFKDEAGHRPVFRKGRLSGFSTIRV